MGAPSDGVFAKAKGVWSSIECGKGVTQGLELGFYREMEGVEETPMGEELETGSNGHDCNQGRTLI